MTPWEIDALELANCNCSFAVEKLVPGGNRLARPMGAVLVLAGLALVAANFDAG